MAFQKFYLKQIEYTITTYLKLSDYVHVQQFPYNVSTMRPCPILKFERVLTILYIYHINFNKSFSIFIINNIPLSLTQKHVDLN